MVNNLKNPYVMGYWVIGLLGYWVIVKNNHFDNNFEHLSIHNSQC